MCLGYSQSTDKLPKKQLSLEKDLETDFDEDDLLFSCPPERENSPR